MKIYLETTIPNFLVADDAPDKREMTELFVRWLHLSTHKVFISDLVLQEIVKTREPRQSELHKAVETLQANLVTVPQEARMLAQRYLTDNILPVRFTDDLLHIATAVCLRMDMVVSWNMKHLAKPTRVARINTVNRLYGWPLIRVHTPKEVLGL